MKRLYILAALALSTQSLETIYDPTPDAWYTGDCLETLDPNYGTFDFNCGEQCFSRWLGYEPVYETYFYGKDEDYNYGTGEIDSPSSPAFDPYYGDNTPTVTPGGPTTDPDAYYDPYTDYYYDDYYYNSSSLTLRENQRQCNFEAVQNGCYSAFCNNGQPDEDNKYGTYCGNCDYSCQMAGIYCNRQSVQDAFRCLTQISDCVPEDDKTCLEDIGCEFAENYSQCLSDIGSATARSVRQNTPFRKLNKKQKQYKDFMRTQRLKQSTTTTTPTTTTTAPDSTNTRDNGETINGDSRETYGYTIWPNYLLWSGVALFGSDKTSRELPVFCDHFHLHSFFYDTVSKSTDSDSYGDFQVMASTMSGFAIDGLCNHVEWVSLKWQVGPDTDMPSQRDQPGFHCGYYVQYEWAGKGDVFWVIHSMDSVTNILGAFALAISTSLFL